MSEEKPKQTRVNERDNENPWYVMMTIAGEQRQPVMDKALHAKNRRYWNRWATQKLSGEEKNELIAEGRATREDLALLTQEENKIINREIKSRCPSKKLLLDERHINFSNNEFPNDFSCEGFIFLVAVDFMEAKFSGWAWFNKATFPGGVGFNKVIFEKNAEFKKVTFEKKAEFNEAKFSGSAYFQKVTFSGGSDFSKAKFSQCADFSEAKFSLIARFRRATFSRRASFNKAIFSRNAKFNEVTFESKVEFQNSKFEFTTKFNNAKFNGMPPEFHNATLHEDTDWTDIKWPEAPKERKQAIESRRAYERLKLIMAQQNKFSDEHSFLREELRCREVENPKSLATLFSYFYRWFSNYGWSVRRPFIALLFVWLGGLSIYGIELWACKSINFWQSMGISAYNTFPFFHDTYFPKDISLSRPSIIVSGLQTVLGLVFLFLLGLGLRNRFRIK